MIKQPKWLGVLVGTSIHPELADKISNGYTIANNVKIAALTVQRYRSSDGQIYVITESFFNSKLSSRNTTKYLFNEAKLGKSRLVIEVIKSYVDTHNDITYAELVVKFPRHLQGNSGTFTIINEASEIYNKTGHKRHFLKPSEQIQLSDCVIVVSNQWGIGNINNFINHAKSLNYKIEPVID